VDQELLSAAAELTVEDGVALEASLALDAGGVLTAGGVLKDRAATEAGAGFTGAIPGCAFDSGGL
jgi:hypothetical protein